MLSHRQRSILRAPCDQAAFGGKVLRLPTLLWVVIREPTGDPGYALLLKAQKIKLRLGGSANVLEPFPDKPKGMHWRTCDRP
jgi:hypothetical protein